MVAHAGPHEPTLPSVAEHPHRYLEGGSGPPAGKPHDAVGGMHAKPWVSAGGHPREEGFASASEDVHYARAHGETESDGHVKRKDEGEVAQKPGWKVGANMHDANAHSYTLPSRFVILLKFGMCPTANIYLPAVGCTYPYPPVLQTTYELYMLFHMDREGLLCGRPLGRLLLSFKL